jgi:hypothetical protein
MTHKLSLDIVRWMGAERVLKATSEHYRRGLALAFIAGLMFIARSAFGEQFFYRVGTLTTCLCAVAAGCVLIFGSAWCARKFSIATSLILTVVTWATFLLLALTQTDVI